MHMSSFATSMPAAAPNHARVSVGEAVLVMPRQSCRIDDRVFASHATFSSRAAAVVVARPGGGILRYTSYRPIAAFDEAALPSGLAIGDRITRSWDGVGFEVLGLFREGRMLCCELREIGNRAH